MATGTDIGQHSDAMVPAQEKSEQQQQGGGSGGEKRIEVGACLPLEQIKLYVVSKDGSKAEVWL